MRAPSACSDLFVGSGGWSERTGAGVLLPGGTASAGRRCFLLELPGRIPLGESLFLSTHLHCGGDSVTFVDISFVSEVRCLTVWLFSLSVSFFISFYLFSSLGMNAGWVACSTRKIG